MEQDAKKVETSASKIKYVPKRFVVSLPSMNFTSTLPVIISRVHLHPNRASKIPSMNRTEIQYLVKQ